MLTQADVGIELWPCAMATAAQQRAEVKACTAVWSTLLCEAVFTDLRGDLGDKWVEGKYMGLSPFVNDGHVVLRKDGLGNGFLQTLHVRTRLVAPEMPPGEWVAEAAAEEEPPPPVRRRITGKTPAAHPLPPRPGGLVPPREGEEEEEDLFPEGMDGLFREDSPPTTAAATRSSSSCRAAG